MAIARRRIASVPRPSFSIVASTCAYSLSRSPEHKNKSRHHHATSVCFALALHPTLTSLVASTDDDDYDYDCTTRTTTTINDDAYDYDYDDDDDDNDDDVVGGSNLVVPSTPCYLPANQCSGLCPNSVCSISGRHPTTVSMLSLVYLPCPPWHAQIAHAQQQKNRRRRHMPCPPWHVR
eukprot:9483683-Pyramimonas_sp.AAC.2